MKNKNNASKKIFDLKTLLREYHEQESKINVLKTEINSLSSLQDNPIINAPTLSIGVFLLKTQVIEFELKRIVPLADQVIKISLPEETYVNRKVRSEDDFKDYTLGKMINVFCEFEVIVFDELKHDLEKLKKTRNTFTHKLFDQKIAIEEMHQEAKKGIELTNKIIDFLETLKGNLTRKTIEYYHKQYENK